MLITTEVAVSDFGHVISLSCHCMEGHARTNVAVITPAASDEYTIPETVRNPEKSLHRPAKRKSESFIQESHKKEWPYQGD